MRLSSESSAKTDAVSDPGDSLSSFRIKPYFISMPGLSSKLHVRGDQLGQLPHQARGGAWQNGAVGDAVPRAHKHFQ